MTLGVKPLYGEVVGPYGVSTGTQMIVFNLQYSRIVEVESDSIDLKTLIQVSCSSPDGVPLK